MLPGYQGQPAAAPQTSAAPAADAKAAAASAVASTPMGRAATAPAAAPVRDPQPADNKLIDSAQNPSAATVDQKALEKNYEECESAYIQIAGAMLNFEINESDSDPYFYAARQYYLSLEPTNPKAKAVQDKVIKITGRDVSVRLPTAEAPPPPRVFGEHPDDFAEVDAFIAATAAGEHPAARDSQFIKLKEDFERWEKAFLAKLTDPTIRSEYNRASKAYMGALCQCGGGVPLLELSKKLTANEQLLSAALRAPKTVADQKQLKNNYVTRELEFKELTNNNIELMQMEECHGEYVKAASDYVSSLNPADASAMQEAKEIQKKIEQHTGKKISLPQQVPTQAAYSRPGMIRQPADSDQKLSAIGAVFDNGAQVAAPPLGIARKPVDSDQKHSVAAAAHPQPTGLATSMSAFFPANAAEATQQNNNSSNNAAAGTPASVAPTPAPAAPTPGGPK